MTTADTPTSVLPEVITRYLAAHRDRDAATAMTACTADVVIVDDGHTYTGASGIRDFFARAAAGFSFTSTLISAEEIAPGQYVAVHSVAGDFPGSPIDLRYRFALRDGLIASLVIAP